MTTSGRQIAASIKLSKETLTENPTETPKSTTPIVPSQAAIFEEIGEHLVI